MVHLGRLKAPRKAAGQMDLLTFPSGDGADMRGPDRTRGQRTARRETKPHLLCPCGAFLNANSLMKRNHHTFHKGDNLRLMRVMSAPLVLEQHIVTRVLHFVLFWCGDTGVSQIRVLTKIADRSQERYCVHVTLER